MTMIFHLTYAKPFCTIVTKLKAPFTYERLADTLWPDDGLDNPYRAVGNLAYRLRRILSIIDLEDLVVGKSGTFVFNEKYSIYTDFDRFEGMYLRLERENNPEMRYTLYNNAIALYRGKLLSKIAHQHWIMPKSVYYHNIYLHWSRSIFATNSSRKSSLLHTEPP